LSSVGQSSVVLVSRYPTHFPISHSFPDKSYYRGFNAYIAKHGYIRSLSSTIACIHCVHSAHYIFYCLGQTPSTCFAYLRSSIGKLRLAPTFPSKYLIRFFLHSFRFYQYIFSLRFPVKQRGRVVCLSRQFLFHIYHPLFEFIKCVLILFVIFIIVLVGR